MKVYDTLEQGSPEWFAVRLGKITASVFKDLKPTTRGKGKTRKNKILDIVAETVSGTPIDVPQTRDMERGTFLEPYARETFSRVTGLEVNEVGFILADDERIGCSPDGLIGDDTGIEIKCPRPRQHVRNVQEDGLDDYRLQAQGCMWVSGRRFWYLVSYCPHVPIKPIHIVRIDALPSVFEAFDDWIISAANEVQANVEAIKGMEASEPLQKSARLARDAWDNVLTGGFNYE